jgi:hypothetical protein
MSTGPDGFNYLTDQCLRRPVARWLGILLVAGALMTSMSACTFLEWVDKKKPPEVPGEEHARLDRLKKQGAGSSGGPASMIDASPEAIDFGDTRIGTESQHTIVFSNPSAFDVAVVKVTVDGVGFSLSNQVSPRVIPTRGQLALVITFRPAERQRHSGSVLLEIDSAGGRFSRVRLKGRGIRG